MVANCLRQIYVFKMEVHVFDANAENGHLKLRQLSYCHQCWKKLGTFTIPLYTAVSFASMKLASVFVTNSKLKVCELSKKSGIQLSEAMELHVLDTHTEMSILSWHRCLIFSIVLKISKFLTVTIFCWYFGELFV